MEKEPSLSSWNKNFAKFGKQVEPIVVDASIKPSNPLVAMELELIDSLLDCVNSKEEHEWLLQQRKEVLK